MNSSYESSALVKRMVKGSVIDKCEPIESRLSGKDVLKVPAVWIWVSDSKAI